MPPSRVTLVAHTHWDREWYEPFEIFRAHLVDALDDALDELEGDPRLIFTLDGQVSAIDDYLELRPLAEPRISALVKAGRLHIGPWYTQADTLVGDAEVVIRNLARGLARAEALGGAMRVGYMPDQFGHAAQLPQILRLFGMDSAVLWRGVGPERPPAAFRWMSPDGSWVTAVWLPDGYSSGRRLPSDPEGFSDAIERVLGRLGAWAGELPLLIPVGDDHVRLAAWLPDAAAALRARRPDLTVAIGGYHDHLPHLGEIDFAIKGELRSPAFAPVLAGVASARVREKQAAARATTLLLRYAEPLCAWAGGGVAASLLDRAWKLLLLNQAHDSAAGCGIDAAHKDVAARYRWAEQLGQAAVERALARLRVECEEPHVAVYHPGPAARFTVVETHVPRSLSEPLSAVGRDGILRPVQPLGAADEQPIFEGDFAAADLAQHLGGLDPKTPLFGRYLTGITMRDEGGGLVRLDVGLGEVPPPPGALDEDQRRVQALIEEADRFHVVLHAAAPTRPVLVAAGPAGEAELFAIEIRPGESELDEHVAPLVEGVGIRSEFLTVTVLDDGSVRIEDLRRHTAVRANDLVDEGDRGDLYHFEGVGPLLVARKLSAEVVEPGPLRARLRVVSELELPLALDGQRRARSSVMRTVQATTEITLTAGSARVDFTTTLDNPVCDHRLRARVHLPFAVERLDVEHGLAVVRRPLDAGAALGNGIERAAPTGQHHGFVDATDGKKGVALFSRGLIEHELCKGPGGDCLALTLLRSVGWLSRGDLSVMEQAAGPILPTPDAQELGEHRFEYAVLLHEGDWRHGGVLHEARQFAAPSRTVRPSGRRPVPPLPLVEITPPEVVSTALAPFGEGILVRLLNTSDSPMMAQLRPARPLEKAELVDPLGRPTGEPLAVEDGAVRLAMRPWRIITLVLR